MYVVWNSRNKPRNTADFFCLRNSYSKSFNFYSPFFHIPPLSSKHHNLLSEDCKHMYSVYIIFTFPSFLSSSSHVLLPSVPNSWLFLLVLLCVHIQTYNYLSPLRFANMHLCSWLTTWDWILYQDVIPGKYLSILSQNPFIAYSRMAVLVYSLDSMLSRAVDNCLSLQCHSGCPLYSVQLGNHWLFSRRKCHLHYWGYLARLVILVIPRLYSWVVLLIVFLFCSLDSIFRYYKITET